MEKKKFEQLLKKRDYKKIIYMHCNSDITLTDSQLNKVIDLKNKKEKTNEERKVFKNVKSSN